MLNHSNDYMNNPSAYFDPANIQNYQRYAVSLQRSGLSDEEKEVIAPVFQVKSPQEALQLCNVLLRKYENQSFRCSYNTKFFLESLAIVAEADIAGV